MKDMFQSFHLTKKMKEQTLITRWPEIMGPIIASRTKSLFIKNQILYVFMTSSPIKHEMSMNKSKIMSLLLSELGEPVIKNIIIK